MNTSTTQQHRTNGEEPSRIQEGTRGTHGRVVFINNSKNEIIETDKDFKEDN
jgi:hypothetical protein